MLLASVLWGTTGTAAAFAPRVGPPAIGAAAMGLGGLLQALMAGHRIARVRTALRAQWRIVLIGGTGVALYPLAMITPSILGGGKTIFPEDGALHTLEPASTVTSGTGVQVCTHRSAAED